METEFKIPSSQINVYIDFVKRYFKKNKKTSTIQIDTLILLFRITQNQQVFKLLLELHKFLLDKILNAAYTKYQKSLYIEDYSELRQMLKNEFFRRVLCYEFPSRSPFSAYVKSYLSKWLNTYIKIMVKKNNRYILFTDYYKDDNTENAKNQTESI